MSWRKLRSNAQAYQEATEQKESEKVCLTAGECRRSLSSEPDYRLIRAVAVVPRRNQANRGNVSGADPGPVAALGDSNWGSECRKSETKLAG